MAQNANISHFQSALRELVRHHESLLSQFSSVGSSSQCHALVELDVYKILNMGQLSTLLNLDNSTTTRLVAPLLMQDLCRMQADKHDRRNKLISLTRKGKALARKIQTHAQAQIEQTFTLMQEKERNIVHQGIITYANTLKRSHLKQECRIQELSKSDIPHLNELVAMVASEYNINHDHPRVRIAEADVRDILATYSLPKRNYYVLKHNKQIVGGAGYCPLSTKDGDICIIKGFNVLLKIQGLGLGSLLLQTITEQATLDGFKQCYLEVYDCLQQSRSFYKRLGFTELDKPLVTPKHNLTNRWYIKEL